MERKVKFVYEDSMDLLNCLLGLEQILPQFGVKLEVLDGGDGYEEIRLTKIEPPSCGHPRVYFNVEHDNFYCCKCNQGMGNEFYHAHIFESGCFPTKPDHE